MESNTWNRLNIKMSSYHHYKDPKTKIRWSWDRLIFIMEIHRLNDGLYIYGLVLDKVWYGTPWDDEWMGETRSRHRCRPCTTVNGHHFTHYSDVIMRAMAYKITFVSVICSTVCSGADQRKHQSSASLDFVRVIHRWPVDSPHKRPVTRKMLPLDDVIMPVNDSYQ